MENRTATGSPPVLVFACRWCAGIGAEDAGRRRLTLPDGFRVIDVDCAGQVEPDAVLRALASGADGVAVLGCHLGGCRFHDANHAAAKRLEALGDLLEAVGIGRERLLLSFGTVHEGPAFAELLGDFTAALAARPTLAAWRAPLLSETAWGT